MENLDMLRTEKRGINNKIMTAKSDISSFESDVRKKEANFSNLEIEERKNKKTIVKAKMELDRLAMVRKKEDDDIRMFHTEKGNSEKKLDRLFIELRDIESRIKAAEKEGQRANQF